MTTADVAAALGINSSRVRQLVLTKRLTPVRRVRGAYLFSPEEVARFRAQPRRPGRPRNLEAADTPVPRRPRGRPRGAGQDAARAPEADPDRA